MKGFLDFIREQGVIGLAVGFILGGAVAKFVTAFINDLISPVLGVILGMAGGLKDASLNIGPVKLFYGDFIASSIDFLVIALVVYFGVKILKLDRLDKKKT
ncbi:MAG: Large-conductance mechanosensitive channel-like protein [Candidatus Shapirobacteria bacterium GW2011_GWE1_38_10]|uniref:Large-conductance mechanosensitive channel-like protein n=1 Tax=Candidatus Shapirobacteria bacterium GW2011_GWE1_38_10 TaxID=1618488 RepID=A0A0G0L7S0_9BACT|nr:MAG: Large-conductance mechanosensitive channel-like protein [Candidatus Shapirobacteria bacterium GW2011_GWF2_37_20]KKQ48691.1 MAG: Large-conductance mechanosensitive channel-like protein [Candidatus Shapirobacteria bacterium GW2011_GWE1_38_10]KKQ62677.1 MAG: Large-conductance mechanosensitive channel-like protein [Candidatus Shapirobacteria bacterium GW2011_GWF1_38_23]HBP50834.1 mechanosensitive ion channel protein MscL [Candidatus Shapirobacteria bacterium]